MVNAPSTVSSFMLLEKVALIVVLRDTSVSPPEGVVVLTIG